MRVIAEAIRLTEVFKFWQQVVAKSLSRIKPLPVFETLAYSVTNFFVISLGEAKPGPGERAKVGWVIMWK